jgi:hypothetical protein
VRRGDGKGERAWPGRAAAGSAGPERDRRWQSEPVECVREPAASRVAPTTMQGRALGMRQTHSVSAISSADEAHPPSPSPSLTAILSLLLSPSSPSPKAALICRYYSGDT